MQAQATRPAPNRQRPKGNGSLRRSLGYLRNHRRTAVFAYGALIIATLAQLVVPSLIRNMINAITEGAAVHYPPIQRAAYMLASGRTVDELEAAADAGQALLVNGVLLILVFALVRGLFAFIQAYAAEATSQGIAFDLRNEIFAKLQRLSFSYYDRTQTGQLMIRATDDVEKVRLFIAQGLMMAVGAFLLLGATLIILFSINWQLTIVVLPILPLTLVLFMFFGRVTQPLFADLQRRLSTLNTILQENVAGIKVVKAFVSEKREADRFNASSYDLFLQTLKVSLTFAILFPLISFVAQFGQAGLLYFGGRDIIIGGLTLGDYQQFTLYVAYVFIPLGQLGFIITLMAQASASAARIFEILDAESDVKDKPNAAQLPAIHGEVEFRNVTFKYLNTGEPVLNNVSFTVKPGQTVALLGATGSGKTTIINLLPRFYDPTEGAVLIDGHDLRDVTLDSLRSQIGIVLQETNLFSGTIRDNIAFGRPNASDEDVMSAAKASAAHDFIMSFPQGYDTPVGERGTTLSGGQKQRIAIARALLLNPQLLILDDSTSSVDLGTESQIQRALDNLMRGRTSFVIAQRISTVRSADLILVLDKGRVVGSGTHAELLEQNEIYADIYTSQLVEDATVQTAEEGQE